MDGVLLSKEMLEGHGSRWMGVGVRDRGRRMGGGVAESCVGQSEQKEGRVHGEAVVCSPAESSPRLHKVEAGGAGGTRFPSGSASSGVLSGATAMNGWGWRSGGTGGGGGWKQNQNKQKPCFLPLWKLSPPHRRARRRRRVQRRQRRARRQGWFGGWRRQGEGGGRVDRGRHRGGRGRGGHWRRAGGDGAAGAAAAAAAAAAMQPPDGADSVRGRPRREGGAVQAAARPAAAARASHAASSAAALSRAAVCAARTSSKKGWSNASAAVMREDGSRESRRSRRAAPSGPTCGTAATSDPGRHAGHAACQSGSPVTPGHSASVGVPRTRKMDTSWPTCESPGKSATPVAISASTHPAAHTSIGVEYDAAPSNSSGARYHRVTTSWV